MAETSALRKQLSPLHPQKKEEQLTAPHSALGSVPSGMGEHVPDDPDTLQALHVPVHELVQQTLSTQSPVPQSLGSSHEPPEGTSGTHADASQWALASQSESPAHEVAQDGGAWFAAPVQNTDGYDPQF